MSKILAVFGATGQQGGSVIKYVLEDRELSQQHKIRAITRDVNSDKAKQLQKKVEVVYGDLLDQASLETALASVHTIFLMTAPFFGPDAFNREYNCVKRAADVAVEKGVEYIIFSTLPSVKDISGGKFTQVIPFDAKAAVEQYIRGLPIKSAFYCPGSFMENFTGQTAWAPQQTPDGSWVIATHVSPKTRIPLIDCVGNSGTFVGAILAEPEKYEGKTFSAATRLYDLEEIIASYSKATGRNITYKQISEKEFRNSLPEAIANIFVEGFKYYEEFGYFGPDMENLVTWAAENARGKLNTWEEYLETRAPKLS